MAPPLTLLFAPALIKESMYRNLCVVINYKKVNTLCR